MKELITRNNSIFDFNCNKKNDRLKINKFNKNFNQNIIHQNLIHPINKYKFEEEIYKNIFLNQYLQSTTNYNKYFIYENPDYKYKNHIYIINNNFPCIFDELILNKHYTIIANNINYKYERHLQGKNINDIQYIIFYNHDNLIQIHPYLKNISIDNCENLELFLEKKIIMLQIGIPEFKYPDRLKNHYNSWDIEKIWNVKLNKYLCNEFIKNNYNHCINISLQLIYSITSKTDLIRHLFLYKHGGLYMDLSIKLLDNSFLNLCDNYYFITSCEKDNKKTFLNGILFSKLKQNKISKYFIEEIVSGVINECLNNNKTSIHFNKKPSKNSFFFGPNTLYNIYQKLNLKNDNKFLLLTCKNKEIKNNTYNSSKNEFNSIVIYNKINYLQCKYIGYYSDLEKINKTIHYSCNYKNKIYYYSILEYIDKILIINLKHRIDRKKEIMEQLSRLNISEKKYEFIDGIYDKENGANGCTKSHLKCINYALENNLENICILEDDYNFHENIENLNIELLTFFIKVKEWDALLLYVSKHGPPIHVNTNIKGIYQNYWSQSTAGFILNKNIFYDFKLNCENILKYNQGPIDFYWNHLKIKYKWFLIKNTMGYQRESYSDIENKIVINI